MDVKLVPIPHEALEHTLPTWLPFIEKVAAKAREHPWRMVEEINTGRVKVHVVWDAENKHAIAAGGTRVVLRGDDRLGEISWLSGTERKAWEHLFPEFEQYMREHEKCDGLYAIVRKGWRPTLEAMGYRMTHVIMSKDF